MIQYIGVIQVHETMQNKRVCWRFVWSGDAKRLIIGVPTQSVGTSKSKSKRERDIRMVKNSIMCMCIFVLGCIFLISEDKVQARNMDYYGLSKYKSNTPEFDKTYTKTSFITLSSSYRDLSVSQVQSISNIYIHKKHSYGFYGHSTIVAIDSCYLSYIFLCDTLSDPD